MVQPGRGGRVRLPRPKQTVRVRGGLFIGPRTTGSVWTFLQAGAASENAAASALGAVRGTVAEAIEAGGGPFDVLPDGVLCRILFYAARVERREEESDSDSDSDSDDSSDSGGSEGGEGREGGDVLVRPHALVRLSHVSQRFRALAMEPALWERLSLPRPSEPAAGGLARLPGRTREAVRGLRVRCGRAGMTYEALRRLHGAFRPTLESLHLSFDCPPGRMPLEAVPLLRHLPRLRHLHLGTTYDRLTDEPEAFLGPLLQASLGLLSLAALTSLELVHFPLTVAQLQILERSPLAASLRSLVFSVYHDGEDEEIATIAAVSTFTGLERLDIEFFEPETGEQVAPTADNFHLEPFAKLTRLKNFSFACDMEWVGFLRSMPALEQVTLNVTDDVDLGPLTALEGTLRGLLVSQPPPSEGSLRSLAAALPPLRSLAAVHLDLSAAAFEALAARPLEAWTSLRTALLGCSPEHPPIPTAFLERLAMDVPSLERLALASPLALPEAAFAIAAMPRLKRVRVTGAAAAALDEAERESLRFALVEGNPGLRVEFSEEGAEEAAGDSSGDDGDGDDDSDDDDG